MSTNAPARAIMDHNAALSRVGGDEELLKELALLFMEEYPRLMSDLRDAYGQGDLLRVERAAHSLKGSVANFGAKEIIDLAAAIEDAGRENDASTVGAKLEPLGTGLAGLRKELTEL